MKEPLPAVKESNNSIEDDSAEARQNIKQLIETGNRALEEALDLAIQSESPRAFEVLTNMIKTLADLNGQIIDVHAKTNRTVKESAKSNGGHSTLPAPDGSAPGSVTNNYAFVGTSSELSKFIAQQLAGGTPPKPIDGDIVE